MSQQQSSGSGAGVALVVVCLLMGLPCVAAVLVVLGGAFFFVSRDESPSMYSTPAMESYKSVEKYDYNPGSYPATTMPSDVKSDTPAPFAPSDTFDKVPDTFDKVPDTFNK